MKTTLLVKKAFTMLELLFVIVIIGILSAVIIPRSRTNPLQEAAIQLASDIRYTQHLAMIDDTYNSSRKDLSGAIIWYKDRWQLVFSNSEFTDYKFAYTIFSDTQGNANARGDAQESEIARNPQNINQIMTGGYNSTVAIDYTKSGFKGMRKLNLGDSYGVSSVNLSGGCKNSRISFDYLGRPMQGDQSSMTEPYNTIGAANQRLIIADCDVTLSDGSSNIIVKILKETGYVQIIF